MKKIAFALLIATSSLKAVHISPCPDDPPRVVPCPCQPALPDYYPSAPARGSNCALTVASIMIPIILIVGIGAVILSQTGDHGESSSS